MRPLSLEAAVPEVVALEAAVLEAAVPVFVVPEVVVLEAAVPEIAAPEDIADNAFDPAVVEYSQIVADAFYAPAEQRRQEYLLHMNPYLFFLTFVFLRSAQI